MVVRYFLHLREQYLQEGVLNLNKFFKIIGLWNHLRKSPSNILFYKDKIAIAWLINFVTLASASRRDAWKYRQLKD